MNKILKYVLRLQERVIYSIAFIPTLMVILWLIFGFLIFNFDGSDSSKWIKDNLEFVLVNGTDSARMVLTTIIGGVISLTVFSFSMVMVVLNRTSASFSPRVLPQLVAQKFHQIVLGFYMGTIVYSLILVVKIDSDENLPSLGILLAMIFAIISLGLFIYFIHSISEAIQVDNILSQIFKKTQRANPGHQ